ncbi:MAG: hypothetical protein AAGJ18_30510, partial [Bacteroidota bacterium]
MEKEKIGYRPATRDDFDLIFGIKKKLLKPYIEQIWGWDEKQQIEFNKGKFNHELIQILKYGTAEIGYLELKEQNGAIIIQNILINDNYQSRGIGKEVILKVMH